MQRLLSLNCPTRIFGAGSVTSEFGRVGTNHKNYIL